MNFFSTAVAALLLAGNAFFCFPFGRVRRDVVIDGIDVGGLPYRKAEALLREELSERVSPIVVETPSGTAVFDDELTLSDDAARLVRRAKRGERLRLDCSLQWADMETALYALCEENSEDAENAEFSFSPEGFSYIPEKKGRFCDYAALLADVGEALERGGGRVRLRVKEYSPPITEALLRERTQKISSFTTYFDGGNAPRAHNIGLAASRISGTVLAPHEEFSFNQTVGARTRENGFEIAAVILDGEFVPGVGGGVCQASTTLFGAALRAGLCVTESRPHSLSVGYVPPSLDAMVSSESDLKFVNPYDFPVYLLGRAGENCVTFTIFGAPDGRSFETESVVLSRIMPAEPQIVEGDGDRMLRAEKEGILSESYLKVFDKEGRLLSRTRIRRDRYAPVQGKIMKKRETSSAPAPAETEQGAVGDEQKAGWGRIKGGPKRGVKGF